MIVRALIQPFDNPVAVTGAIKTTPVSSEVQDLGAPMSYKGNEIMGTDVPLKGMGMKLIVNAETNLTEDTAGTNSVIITILTGTDGTTATAEKARFTLSAEELNRGVEIPMPDLLIHRSLKFTVSATADSAFTAGKINILLE